MNKLITNALTLKQIEINLKNKNGKCVSCQKSMTDQNSGYIDSYNHNSGIAVYGFDEKQWVFWHCICGYDSAVWKILKQSG